MIDSKVPKTATKTLATPHTTGWMCHGLFPVRCL